MFPTLVEGPGGLNANTYGLFIMLAFVCAFLITFNRSMRAGIHPVKLLPVMGAAAVGGLAGGRILYSIAVEPGLMGLVSNPGSLFAGSGFAVYGGLIGGTLAVAAVAIPRGIPPWKLADIAAPSVLMGMGVGRLACFFAGCCHGAVVDGFLGSPAVAAPLQGVIHTSSSFPWLALEFHAGVGSLHHVPLYPTQLWDFAALVTLSAVMLALWEYRRFDGQLAALTLMLQPIVRIFVEGFRADHRGVAFELPFGEQIASVLPGMAQAGAAGSETVGLTTSQALGLGMMAAGLVIWVLRRNAGVADEIPLDLDMDLEEEPA